MSSNKPFFSIVMPTYNRAQLLSLAIQSVLQQTFADFEIIVHNSASPDNTHEVVMSFDDPRIHYIETENKLSAGDNYQSGLSHARGEYITFLSDDDAYAPVLLERAQKVIHNYQAQIVGYPYCRYYHTDYFDLDRPIKQNSLLVPQFTGQITKFSAANAVKQVFNCHGLKQIESNHKFVVPYLSNAVYHRSIFERVKAVRSNLFHTVPADMYLAAAVFFVTDEYFCLDEPLLLWSIWEGNSTASARRKGNALRAHYEKLLNGNELRFTPLKFALPLNCGINAVLEAKHDFENTVNDTNVDWLKYYELTYENLISLKNEGVDISRELKEFEQTLLQMPIEFQQQARREISRIAPRTKRFLRANLPSTTRSLRRFLNLRTDYKPRIIEGDKANFDNVLEAAQTINHEFLDQSSV